MSDDKKPDRFAEIARETFKKVSNTLCKWTADKPIPWLIHIADEDKAISIFAQALREEAARATEDIKAKWPSEEELKDFYKKEFKHEMEVPNSASYHVYIWLKERLLGK